jgi:hypothetical protein
MAQGKRLLALRETGSGSKISTPNGIEFLQSGLACNLQHEPTMALITRRECGHTVSSDAVNCPTCSAPNRPNSQAKSIKILRHPLAWLSLGLALFAVLIMIGTERISSPPPTQTPIKAEIALTDLSVVIINLDDFTWPSATVYVNGTSRDGYRAGSRGPLASNHRLNIPFTEFVRGDLRFNAYTQKINRVMVSVQGHDALTFSFQ